MNKEPVIQFKSQKELEECAMYWINKLLLDRHFIVVIFVPKEEISGSQGETKNTPDQEIALVRIADTVDFGDSEYVKICQELTLVHELLHIKYSLLTFPTNYEGQIAEYEEHKNLEQMAKSLLMVKYDISYDWFRNNNEVYMKTKERK